MSVARLIVLGILSTHGPLYGHQIRRVMETIQLEAWSEVRVGSIYNALHRLEGEGLIRQVRTEQEGRLPARTVYEITGEGERELALLRHRGLSEVRFATDPFDVALWVSAGKPQDDLRGLVEERLQTLRTVLASTTRQRERLAEQGYLPPAGLIIFRHSEARVEAELRWHEELLDQLSSLGEQTASWPAGGPWVTQAADADAT